MFPGWTCHLHVGAYASGSERETRIAGRVDGGFCALAHPRHVAAELQRRLRAGLLRRSLLLPRHGLVAALGYSPGYRYRAESLLPPLGLECVRIASTQI